MQTGKNAAAVVMETAVNIAASAKSGKEKAKAVTQEKVERMTAHDPMEKEMATEKKKEKIHDAELNKKMMREQNAATKHHTAANPGHTGPMTAAGTGTDTYSTTDEMGQSTGMHQMSAVPRHGLGQTNDMVTEGVAVAHPANTGTAGGTGHNPRAGPTMGTGGTYGHGTSGTA